MLRAPRRPGLGTNAGPTRGQRGNKESLMRIERACMLVVFAALSLGAAGTALAQGASASQKAFAPARQELDRAIAAHGGLEALRAIKDLQRTGNATAYNQGQSLR